MVCRLKSISGTGFFSWRARIALSSWALLLPPPGVCGVLGASPSMLALKVGIAERGRGDVIDGSRVPSRLIMYVCRERRMRFDESASYKVDNVSRGLDAKLRMHAVSEVWSTGRRCEGRERLVGAAKGSLEYRLGIS
jgi:hypothetical protein